MAELLRRPDWHASAACRGADTEAFFPGQGGDLEPALTLCSACPVIEECREAGDGEQGVWGGTSQRQRTRARSVIRSSGRRKAPGAAA